MQFHLHYCSNNTSVLLPLCNINAPSGLNWTAHTCTFYSINKQWICMCILNAQFIAFIPSCTVIVNVNVHLLHAVHNVLHLGIHTCIHWTESFPPCTTVYVHSTVISLHYFYCLQLQNTCAYYKLIYVGGHWSFSIFFPTLLTILHCLSPFFAEHLFLCKCIECKETL